MQRREYREEGLCAMDQRVDRSRAFIKDGSVTRVVVKVGTAVVTRSDGKIALQRISAVCEQVRELLDKNIEVIVVTSGAIGVGRQMLRYHANLQKSFYDMHLNVKEDLDAKACAAMGQIRLMALYKTFFELLNAEAAQILVTENDFRDQRFTQQIKTTVFELLAKKIVPVFNENDAISETKDPYKVIEDEREKIFRDNDSLAALLAKALGAQLLVMLSDVEGLYTGHPTDCKSKLIHTYLPEKHDEKVRFVDTSYSARVGRGGMEAKVRAARDAAEADVPTVVGSGYQPEILRRIFRGERVGTLFHKHANQWAAEIESGASELATAAKNAGRRLQSLSQSERRQILLKVADALMANEKLIMAENEADLQAARDSRMAPAQAKRLNIKVSDFADSFRGVADMEDPVGKVLRRTEVCEGLILEKTYSPVGVVLVIFESRPDAVVQIASLAIRSGNGLLLKGGAGATRSNAMLHKVITEALPKSVGPQLIGLVTSRDEIPDLLQMADCIDLVIPRGGKSLVETVKGSTKIPVLGYSDGVCHIYVDEYADIEMAEKIVQDSKLDYPAASNSMETLLVHESLVDNKAWEPIYCRLQFAGVKMFGGPEAAKRLNLQQASSLHTQYSALECTVEIVKNVEAAIKHINEFGSSHTDCIVTENTDVAEKFLKQVDSAAIFRNASTRFCDGYRFGLGAEVGISTSRIHARGPLGVEGLLTTRWIMKGNGHIVDGDKAISYKHTALPLDDVVPKFSTSKLANGGKVNAGFENGNGHFHTSKPIHTHHVVDALNPCGEIDLQDWQPVSLRQKTTFGACCDESTTLNLASNDQSF